MEFIRSEPSKLKQWVTENSDSMLTLHELTGTESNRNTLKNTNRKGNDNEKPI